MIHTRSLVVVGCVIALSSLAACSGTAGRKAHYLERGQSYLAAGKYDKARVEFSNALQIDPNDANARYFAGQVAEKLGKPRDAVGNYQAAIEADTNLIAARAALGRIFLLGGLPDKASEVIGPGLTKEPDNAQLRTVRGGLRALQGDLEGAMEDAQAAVKAAPNDEVAIAFLAAQYTRQKLLEDAMLVLNDGIKKLPNSVDLRVILANLLFQTDHKAEALAQLQTVAKAHKTELVHWQRVAQLQLLMKDTDGAIASLREAVAGAPDNIEAKSALVSLIGSQKDVPAALAEMQKFVDAEPKRAELQVALAQFQEAAKQPEKAEATYRALIKSQGLGAQGLVARDRLAAMLIKRNDLAGAEALIGEVLKDNPRDNDALILRAGIAMTHNQTAAAITDLRSVLRDQPNSAPLMRALARAHVQNNEAALAEEVLRQAVQTNPGDTQSRFELAGLLASTARGNLALPILEQLIKDAPDNLQARESYFRVQTSMSDFAGARKTADEIHALRPDLPLGSMLAGTLLEREGKLAEATAQYESALKVSSDPSEPLTLLVRVDLKQHQPAKAKARLDAILAKVPNNPMAHELLGELLLSQGNALVAVQEFDAAIATQPTWWLPYRAKANAQLTAKQLDQALATWSVGVTRSGALELYADLATAYQKQGKPDQAIATYEDALKRYPQALPVANNLAMLLIARKDKASLERAAQVAQVLSGIDQSSMLDTLGWVKFQNGAVNEALPLLQKALEKIAGIGGNPLPPRHGATAQRRQSRGQAQPAVGARRNTQVQRRRGCQVRACHPQRHRLMRGLIATGMAAMLWVAAGSVDAATIAAAAQTLGATSDLTARLPAAQTFTVTAGAQLKVVLGDLATPQAFTQLKLLLSRGGSKVASLDAAGIVQFAATPGDYKIQVVGVPAAASGATAAGTFDVQVTELTGNTVLKHFADGISAVSSAPATSIAFAQAGTYQVTLTDRGFPAALSNISLLLNPASASGAMGTLSGPCTNACTTSINVTAAGSYDLFVVATAAEPDQAGLYSLKIIGQAMRSHTQPRSRWASLPRRPSSTCPRQVDTCSPRLILQLRRRCHR